MNESPSPGPSGGADTVPSKSALVWRLVIGGIALLALTAFVVGLVAPTSTGESGFRRIRRSYDEHRRALEQHRREWEQQRREREEQRRAEQAATSTPTNAPGGPN